VCPELEEARHLRVGAHAHGIDRRNGARETDGPSRDWSPRHGDHHTVVQGEAPDGFGFVRRTRVAARQEQEATLVFHT